MGYLEQVEKALVALVDKWNPKANIYAVGGYVRDEIMNRMRHDFDLVIDLEGDSSPAVHFTDFLKDNKIQGTSGFTVYPKFGTAKFDLTIPYGNGTRTEPIECVMPRAEEYKDGPRKPSEVSKTTLEADASRRDFCCNALYKDLRTGKILDPTGKGLSDIENKILRTPLDPEETFRDDPLRMLRAVRFAAKLDFDIDPTVLTAMKPIPEYYQLSMERVRDEFEKIITSWEPSKYIWILHEKGLLGYIIPEFEEAWGFNQNSKYHSMNLTDHILSVLNKTSSGDRRGIIRGSAILPWAALLHDISKYKDFQVKEDGTFSFHGHEKKSAQMAESILRRLKCPEKDISRVCKLIGDHMIIKQFYNYSDDTYTGTKKYTRKIASKYPDRSELESLMKLIDADNKSHAPQWCMPGQVDSFYKAYDDVVYGISSSVSSASTKLPIDGSDIMNRYGFKSGKQIGKIKDMLQELFYEDPSMDSETLFRMYEAEFKGSVWIWTDGFMNYNASIIKPVKEGKGYQIEPYDFNEFLRLDPEEEEYYKSLGEDIIELNALEYPDLYMRVRINRRSRELVDKILDIMGEFHQMPGFKEVVVGLDYTNDASGFVKWRNHRTDYIL